MMSRDVIKLAKNHGNACRLTAGGMASDDQSSPEQLEKRPRAPVDQKESRDTERATASSPGH